MHTSALTRDLFISDNAVCVCVCVRVQPVRSQDLGLIFFCGSCNCMRGVAWRCSATPTSLRWLILLTVWDETLG